MNMRHNAVPSARSAPDDLAEALDRRLKYDIGKHPDTATLTDWRLALSGAVRELVVDPWFATIRRVRAERRKRVYYLSMEFLIGRLLEDAIANLGLDEQARAAVEARASTTTPCSRTNRTRRSAMAGSGGWRRVFSIPPRPSEYRLTAMASATSTGFSGRASWTAGRPRTG